MQTHELEEILRKAANIEFGNEWGDCLIMTLCLTRYMKEVHGIELKVHIGALVGSKGTTLHMWNSYKGKMIDLTAHKQRGETAQSFILDKPISIDGNSKRVLSYKLNSDTIRNFARGMTKTAESIDPDVSTISHIFLKYERTGKIPYNDVKDIMNTEERKSYDEKFKLIMNET